MDDSRSGRSAILVPPFRSTRSGQAAGSFKSASTSDEVPGMLPMKSAGGPRDSPTTRASATLLRILSTKRLREMVHVVGNGREHETKEVDIQQGNGQEQGTEGAAIQQGLRPVQQCTRRSMDTAAAVVVESEMEENDASRYSLILSRLRQMRLQNRNQHSNSTMADNLCLLPPNSTKNNVASEPNVYPSQIEAYSSMKPRKSDSLTSSSKSHFHSSAALSKKTQVSGRVTELLDILKEHYKDKDPKLENTILLELNLSEDSEEETKEHVMSMQQLRNKLCCSSFEPMMEGPRMGEAEIKGSNRNQASSMEHVLSPPCSRRGATVLVAEGPTVTDSRNNLASVDPNNTFLHQVSALLTCTASEDDYNDGTESLLPSSVIAEMKPDRAATLPSTAAVYDMSTQQRSPALVTTVAQTPRREMQPRQPVITVTDLGLLLSCGGGCFEKSTAVSSDMAKECIQTNEGMNDNDDKNVGGGGGTNYRARDNTMSNNNNNNNNSNMMMMRQHFPVCPTSVVWEEGELKLDDLSLLTEEDIQAARRGKKFLLGQKLNEYHNRRRQQAVKNKGLQTHKNATLTQHDLGKEVQVVRLEQPPPSKEQDKGEKSKLQRRIASWTLGKSKSSTTAISPESEKTPCRQLSSKTTRCNYGDNDVELVCSPSGMFDQHEGDDKHHDKDNKVHDGATNDSEITTDPTMTSDGPYEVQLAIVAIAGQDDDDDDANNDGAKQGEGAVANRDDDDTDVTTLQGDNRRCHVMMKQLMTSWRQQKTPASLEEGQ